MEPVLLDVIRDRPERDVDWSPPYLWMISSHVEAPVSTAPELDVVANEVLLCVAPVFLHGGVVTHTSEGGGQGPSPATSHGCLRPVLVLVTIGRVPLDS